MVAELAGVVGAELHPELPDVGVTLAEFNGQAGRMLWYPAGDLDSAAIVVEAIKPSKISIGSGDGESIEIAPYDVNITIAMLVDQRTWLRYGDGPDSLHQNRTGEELQDASNAVDLSEL